MKNLFINLTQIQVNLRVKQEIKNTTNFAQKSSIQSINNHMILNNYN